MKKKLNLTQKSLLFSIIILISFTSLGLKGGNTHIALVMKVIQDVQVKAVQNNEWRKAEKADPLNANDQIKTGNKSLAVIKFLTDQSLIRVREKSLVTLSSSTSGNITEKRVDIENGSLGFEIKLRNENEKFKFTSPTSVASIRGTSGRFGRGRDGDTLIVVDGLVNFKNLITGNEIDVGAGFIGFSNNDGTINSRKATEQELAEARSIVTGDNVLKIEFKDSRGNKRELKIEYKK